MDGVSAGPSGGVELASTVKPPSVIALPLSNAEVYEAGAVLLAEVAFGLGTSSKWSRPTLHPALCGYILRCTAALSDEWSWTPQHIKPGYLLVPAEDADRAMSFVAKQLEKRLQAAHTAVPFLQRQIDPLKPLPPGLTPLSLNRATEHTLVGSDRGDGHNFEARVFRRSIPVLHIACAVALAIDDAGRRGLRLAIEHFLVFAELLRWVADVSDQIAELLVQQKQFKIQPSSLTRLAIV
jgi:hypothetical protein